MITFVLQKTGKATFRVACLIGVLSQFFCINKCDYWGFLSHFLIMISEYSIPNAHEVCIIYLIHHSPHYQASLAIFISPFLFLLSLIHSISIWLNGQYLVKTLDNFIYMANFVLNKRPMCGNPCPSYYCLQTQ